MRFVAAFLLAFIVALFVTFAVTTEPIVRPEDAMLYNSKYIRLRLFREEGAAQFRAVNAAAIESRTVLLREELAKAE